MMHEDDYQILVDNDQKHDDRHSTSSQARSSLVGMQRKASLSASIFNLSNTTLGAGIVSIPYFFSQTGVVLGTILLFFISFLGAFASILLVRAANVSDCWSYMEISVKAYGAKGLLAVQLTILSLTIGVMAAFYVQIGDSGGATLDSLLPSSSAGSWWTSPEIVKAVFTFVVLIPLSLQKDLASLAQASMLVLIFLMYLLVMVCALPESVVGDDDDSESDDEKNDESGVKMAFIGPEFFTAFPIVVLAFGNQLNVQQIAIELEEPTNTRIRQVIFSTQTIVSILYLIIGLTGYWHFGSSTADNIMDNYHGLKGSSFVLFTIARVGIVFVVVFSYPMLLFPGRACLHSVLEPLFVRSEDSKSEEEISNSFNLKDFIWRNAFVLETLFLIGLTFLIATVVPVLGVIMGFTGAISGTIQAFIFPAIFHLKLVNENKTAALVLLALGIFFGVVCLVVEIIESI